MLVSWIFFLDNGGFLIIGYWLEKREEGGVYWLRVSRVLIIKTGLKGVEFNVFRLIEGVKYQFRVMVINVVGVGFFSELLDSVVVGDFICKYVFIVGIYKG